jgi:hypothetical protein
MFAAFCKLQRNSVKSHDQISPEADFAEARCAATRFKLF